MFRFFDLGVRKKGVVTSCYPTAPFVPPEGSLGAPELLVDNCFGCLECIKICPTGAIDAQGKLITFDLGLCIYCGECEKGCRNQAIKMSGRFETAGRERKALEVEYHVP